MEVWRKQIAEKHVTRRLEVSQATRNSERKKLRKISWKRWSHQENSPILLRYKMYVQLAMFLWLPWLLPIRTQRSRLILQQGLLTCILKKHPLYSHSPLILVQEQIQHWPKRFAPRLTSKVFKRIYVSPNYWSGRLMKTLIGLFPDNSIYILLTRIIHGYIQRGHFKTTTFKSGSSYSSLIGRPLEYGGP